jgi:hypothetical protein
MSMKHVFQVLVLGLLASIPASSAAEKARPAANSALRRPAQSSAAGPISSEEMKLVQRMRQTYGRDKEGGAGLKSRMQNEMGYNDEARYESAHRDEP